MFPRHEKFDIQTTKLKTGIEDYDQRMQQQAEEDNLPMAEKIIRDALKPKIPKYRIPEREQIPPHIADDSRLWKPQFQQFGVHFELPKTQSKNSFEKVNVKYQEQMV